MGDVEILGKVWLWTIASLVYVYAIVSRLPKNFPRLIASLPILYLFLILPRRFSTVSLIGGHSFLLTWMSNFKVILFCFGLGPLVPLHGSLGSFLLVAALPIKFKPTKTQQTYNHIAKALFRALLAFGLMVLVVNLTSSEQVPRHGMAGPALYTLLILLSLEASLSAAQVPAGLVPYIKLEQQFDRPYLSCSLGEFWGRRWNLIVTNMLRQVVYHPVQVASSAVLGRRLARLAGILATFLVSAAMHELILYNMTAERPSGEWTWFFVLHGLLTAGEAWLGWVLPQQAMIMPRALKVPLTLTTLFLTAFWLFFPPFMRGGLDLKLLGELESFINMLGLSSVRSHNPNNLPQMDLV